jgi:hypothetical protein
MITPLSASQAWQRLLNFARSVGVLELDQNAVQEANQILPSVFVYLARQLKGGHLFPNISKIELKTFDTSAHYFPLLVSPCLKEISVELTSCGQLEQVAISPLCEKLEPTPELTLSVLLNDLASTLPALRSLKLKNIPFITCLTLKPVLQFRHLRVLELTNFANVETFGRFNFLDSFTTLEDLSIAATAVEYVCLSSPTTRETCLPSLKYLRVDAPLEMLLDFLQSIASVDLNHLTFNNSPSAISRVSKIKKTKKKSGNSVRLDFLDILSSRWPLSLKELVIKSSTNIECDLHYLTRFQVLENLFIQGCPVDGIFAVFAEPPSFLNSLRSLSLTEVVVPLRLLKQIAEYAPSLTTLSLSLDIHDTSYANEIRMTNHPLQSLEIHHAVKYNLDIFNDNFPQLIRMARYLNALFPDIRSLTTSTRQPEWEKVRQLVKLCQDCHRDKKAGKLAEESFEVI